jgi:N-methylhydantoinase B
MVEVDPITYEVIRSQLDGIVREMQVTIYRTSYSTLIRETHDMSCGLVDREGNVVAQYAGIPIHLGSYPACIQGLLDFYGYDKIEDGDCFFVNHPYYSGCAHSLDSAAIIPVFYEGELVAFCISISHKGDIGGLSPGSRAVGARDIFGEGMLVPPVKFMSRHQVVRETENLIRVNTRTPELLLGDYRSQAGPEWSVGVRRLKELMDKHGRDTVLAVFDLVGAKTEQRLRNEITRWKDGVHEAEIFLDNDMVDLDKPVRLHVAVTKKGDRLLLDFSESADQNRGPINARPPILIGSCLYALTAMMEDPPPNNHGVARVINFKFRPGSVLNPVYPAPLGFYSHVQSSVEDMVLNALTKAAGRPARAHHSSGGNFTFGSARADGRRVVQYELLPGGGGASEEGDGWTGCGHGGSGPKIACVEIVESEFPVVVQQFKLVPDSAGPGKHRGGLGYIRDYRLLRDGTFSGGRLRYRVPPMGVEGGSPGQCGYILINPGSPRELKIIDRVSNIHLKAGDVVRMYTGSGGGAGSLKRREVSRVLGDLRDGYISPEAARQVYGLSDKTLREARARSSEKAER